MGLLGQEVVKGFNWVVISYLKGYLIEFLLDVFFLCRVKCLYICEDENKIILRMGIYYQYFCFLRQIFISI